MVPSKISFGFFLLIVRFYYHSRTLFNYVKISYAQEGTKMFKNDKTKVLMLVDITIYGSAYFASKK